MGNPIDIIIDNQYHYGIHFSLISCLYAQRMLCIPIQSLQTLRTLMTNPLFYLKNTYNDLSIHSFDIIETS